MPGIRQRWRRTCRAGGGECVCGTTWLGQSERLRRGRGLGLRMRTLRSEMVVTKLRRDVPVLSEQGVTGGGGPWGDEGICEADRHIKLSGKEAGWALSASRMLVYAPLLEWFVALHQTIDYKWGGASRVSWSKGQPRGGRETWTSRRRCTRICLSCWERVRTESSSRPWRGRRMWCTRMTRKWWTCCYGLGFPRIWRRWTS